MKQVTRAIYMVAPGEHIVIEVVATKVGQFARVDINHTMLTPRPGVTPLTYDHTATNDLDTDFGILTCVFPNAAPEDASYQLFFIDPASGSRFTGSDVRKSDGVHLRGFELRK